jgi:LysM repeat protein
MDPDRLVVGQRLALPAAGEKRGAVAERSSGGKKAAGSVPEVVVEGKAKSSVDAVRGRDGVPRALVPAEHEVREGDSLSRLSREYGIPVGELMKRNGMGEGDVLGVGRKIRLRGEVVQEAGKREGGMGAQAADSRSVVVRSSGRMEYHEVERGDSLSGIAAKYNVSLAGLREANPGLAGGPLRVGQRVCVPGVQVKSEVAPVRSAAAPVYPVALEHDAVDDVNVAALGRALEGDRVRTGYQVRRGDTVEGLAREFLLTPGELRALNRLGAKDRVHEGQYLIVPFFRSREELPSRYGHQEGPTAMVAKPRQ